MELIAVVMKCNGAEHYTDTAALFDYGFEHYESVKLFTASEYTATLPVTESYKDKPVDRGTVTIAPTADVYHTLPKGTDASAVTVEADVPESIQAPVTVGQIVGTLKISLNGDVVKTVDLAAQSTVEVLTDAEKQEIDDSSLAGILKKVGIIAAFLLLLFLVMLCITRFIGYQKYKKRLERRRRRTAAIREYEMQQTTHHEHHGYRHRRERTTANRRRRPTNRKR
ncbi:MAG: hypothetical protein IJY52_00155 [Anaerotignum sp.]|nr:hypothetical protein [Anaerotignum sp.]